VAIWSYGAGTTSSNDNYDGAGMAAAGVVFISYNYRTGPWGWLATPELTAASPNNATGNYGLMDQIQVFKWECFSGASSATASAVSDWSQP